MIKWGGVIKSTYKVPDSRLGLTEDYLNLNPQDWLSFRGHAVDHTDDTKGSEKYFRDSAVHLDRSGTQVHSWAWATGKSVKQGKKENSPSSLFLSKQALSNIIFQLVI